MTQEFIKLRDALASFLHTRSDNATMYNLYDIVNNIYKEGVKEEEYAMLGTKTDANYFHRYTNEVRENEALHTENMKLKDKNLNLYNRIEELNKTVRELEIKYKTLLHRHVQPIDLSGIRAKMAEAIGELDKLK